MIKTQNVTRKKRIVYLLTTKTMEFFFSFHIYLRKYRTNYIILNERIKKSTFHCLVDLDQIIFYRKKSKK